MSRAKQSPVGAQAVDPLAPAALVGLQRSFAAHLRHPGENPAPAGIESRRMGIYADLVYRNIESFLSGGFPVTRKLHGDSGWHDLVRGFVARHVSHTPYFTQIGAEFLEYLAQDAQVQQQAPGFLLQLAQYEWAETALFLSADELPPGLPAWPGDDELARMHPVLSPLAWPLVFNYPVHQIGPGNEPDSPSPEPVCLVVYRNAAQQVAFVQLDLFAARMLELVEELAGQSDSGSLVEALGREIPGMQAAQLRETVFQALARFHDLDIIRFS